MSADSAGPIPSRPASSPADPLGRMIREPLPPGLQHLADRPMAEANRKAIAYAQNTVSPATENLRR